MASSDFSLSHFLLTFFRESGPFFTLYKYQNISKLQKYGHSFLTFSPFYKNFFRLTNKKVPEKVWKLRNPLKYLTAVLLTFAEESEKKVKPE